MLHMNAWKDGGIDGGDGDGYNRPVTFHIHLCKISAVHCVKPSALPVHSLQYFYLLFEDLTFLEFQISFVYRFMTIQHGIILVYLQI